MKTQITRIDKDGTQFTEDVGSDSHALFKDRLIDEDYSVKHISSQIRGLPLEKQPPLKEYNREKLYKSLELRQFMTFVIPGTKETKIAETESEFNEIYDREFNKRKIDDNLNIHRIFRDQLIKYVERLSDLHINNRDFDDNTIEIDLLAKAREFVDYVKSMDNGQTVDVKDIKLKARGRKKTKINPLLNLKDVIQDHLYEEAVKYIEKKKFSNSSERSRIIREFRTKNWVRSEYSKMTNEQMRIVTNNYFSDNINMNSFNQALKNWGGFKDLRKENILPS